MNPVTVTLNFPSIAAAHEALAKLAAVDLIAHEDRPDVGLPEEPVALATSTVSSNPFAVAAHNVTVPPAASVNVPPALPISTAPAGAPTAAATVPTPPTAATVPIAAPASASAATPGPAGVELDSSGLPWDGRIHGSTKSKNQDGTWRQKRGLNDPGLKDKVEAELRAAMAAKAPASAPSTPAPVMSPGAASSVPAPSTPPVAPPVPTPPASPSVPPVPAAPTTEPAPAAPAASTTAVPTAPSSPPVPRVAPAGETFGQLMARIAPRMTDATVQAKVNEALGAFQLTALAQLAARPDLVPSFGQTLDAMLA